MSSPIVKNFYFAAIIPDRKTSMYSIIFPDFPEIPDQAENFAEAITTAPENLREEFNMRTLERRDIPNPMSLAAAKAWIKAWFAEYDSSDDPVPYEQIVYYPIPSPVTDKKPVKVMVSLPRNILTLLDSKAEELGVTRSGYLTQAVAAFAK